MVAAWQLPPLFRLAVRRSCETQFTLDVRFGYWLFKNPAALHWRRKSIPPTIASMCCIQLAILAILFGLCTEVDVASADEVEAWTALRAGRHVALMRHTDAPGSGDPPGFRIDDCATQRNLTAKGRLDAATIGSRLRAEGISVERIYSSSWCRCMDTAKLLALG